jgi:hypothetical protein
VRDTTPAESFQPAFTSLVVPATTAAVRKQAWWVFALALVLYSILTHHHVFQAGNDASRFAAIEALVDFNETYIDHSQFRMTVDRVTIGGHDYSNKPPLLSLVGAALYAGIKTATGWSLASQPARVVYLLTLLLVGLPAAGLAAQFFLALGVYHDLPWRHRCGLTLAITAGTLLTSFSGTMNHHVPAAVLLFAGLLAALQGQGARAGLWTGLAACVDVLPGIGLAPVFLWVLRDTGGRRALLRAGAVLSGSAAVFLAANMFVLGSPWLPKLVPGSLDHSVAVGAAVGGVLLPDHWIYPVMSLFGGHGFFSVSPILLFGAAGMVLACSRPGPIHRRWVLPLSLGVGVQVLGHIVFAGAYGGWSYGFRYLIPVIPLLLLFAPAAMAGWRSRLFAGVLPFSIALALLGAYHPWPPAYEQAVNDEPIASLVTNPVGGNAAALVASWAPDSAAARFLGAAFISSDDENRRHYLALFFSSRGEWKMAWRFVPPQELPSH